MSAPALSFGLLCRHPLVWRDARWTKSGTGDGGEPVWILPVAQTNGQNPKIEA
jgi:hypothetical protein